VRSITVPPSYDVKGDKTSLICRYSIGGDPVASAGVDARSAREAVAAAPVGYLATVTSEGRPHIVPFCFVLDGDRVLSVVDAKPKTTLALRRLDNIRAQPAVSLLVDHYDDDWTTLWWVRVDGTAQLWESGSRRDGAVDRLAEKYPQYRRSPPPGPVIAVEISGWHWWP
jgi:PPOX class probable F420-dependent enzyme